MQQQQRSEIEVNVGKLGQLTAEHMERLEQDLQSSGLTNIEIGEAVMIVEVRYRNEDNEDCTDISYWSTDSRAWIIRGLLGYMCKLLDDDLLIERYSR